MLNTNFDTECKMFSPQLKKFFSELKHINNTQFYNLSFNYDA